MNTSPVFTLASFIHLFFPNLGNHLVHDVDGVGRLIGDGHLVKCKSVVATGQISALGGVHL